ncbi:hypothetical protein NL676_025787 [Syzygium grande]|nr:hypothetical protein NL676_025787 [Syzygium grande]
MAFSKVVPQPPSTTNAAEKDNRPLAQLHARRSLMYRHLPLSTAMATVAAMTTDPLDISIALENFESDFFYNSFR